jgi:hypothetical protein
VLIENLKELIVKSISPFHFMIKNLDDELLALIGLKLSVERKIFVALTFKGKLHGEQNIDGEFCKEIILKITSKIICLINSSNI